jgi:hypothetical protein
VIRATKSPASKLNGVFVVVKSPARTAGLGKTSSVSRSRIVSSKRALT